MGLRRKNHPLPGQAGHAKSIWKRYAIRVDDFGNKLCSRREENRAPNQPSFGFIVNKLRVPKKALEALAPRTPTAKLLLRKMTTNERLNELNVMVKLHLKTLAGWRRKGVLSPKDFDLRAKDTWELFEKCKRGICTPEDFMANSWLDIFRKHALKEGEGYYESLVKRTIHQK
ncbi:MAG: hypothetical protein NTY48_04965 [Candidatus Diapherotrites archaeon]|nr:hypothetical protein [Candidatus Diapherotrites archaeon]